MSVILEITWEKPSVDRIDILEKLDITLKEWGNLSDEERQEKETEITDEIREEFILMIKRTEYV